MVNAFKGNIHAPKTHFPSCNTCDKVIGLSGNHWENDSKLISHGIRQLSVWTGLVFSLGKKELVISALEKPMYLQAVGCTRP